jgi:hypothetical protein
VRNSSTATKAAASTASTIEALAGAALSAGHHVPPRDHRAGADLRRAHRGRLVERASEIGDERERDEVEHDRVDDLVRADARLQHARDRGPHGTRERGGGDRRRQQQHRGPGAERRTRHRGREPAEVELAFDADVEQSGAESQRDREPVNTSGVARNSVWPTP